jgi:NitT/TauT family transport system substrate-binding protein
MRKRLLAVLATALVAVSPAVAEGQAERDDAVSFRVGTLKGPAAMGLIRIIDEEPVLSGYVQTTFSLVGNPTIMVSRLLSGEVDAAVLPTNMASILYNRDAPYSVAAVTGYGVLYLVTSSLDLSGVDDLRGMELHTTGKGAIPDYVTRFLLEEHGLDPNADLRLSYYDHPELAQLLISGRAETGVLLEPFVTQVLLGNPDMRIAADLQYLWSQVLGTAESYPMTVLAVRQQFAHDHPRAFAEFLNAYEGSIRWVQDNPSLAATLVEEHDLGMPAVVAEHAVPRANLTFLRALDARPMIERFLRVLYEYEPRSVGGSLPDADFYLGP